MLAANLLAASGMVAGTVVLHFFGLVLLADFIGRRTKRAGVPGTVTRQAAATLVIVFGLFALHMAEIWAYALLYLALGQFSSLEAALYFSTSTFTTVGFGDLLLAEEWRLLSAIESANGFLLIGWSTAFLVSVTGMIRDVEQGISPHASGE